MKTDALARRKRTASQPTDKAVELTDGVLSVLSALRRRSPLPTPLIFSFWKGDKVGNYPHFQRIMTKLFHEREIVGRPGVVGNLLQRPPELNPDFGPNHEPTWHELAPAGRIVAQEGSSVHLPNNRDAYHHRAMGACIDASFELLAPEHGIAFKHLEDILAHPRCPKETVAAKNPLSVKLRKEKVEPDGLFGLEYPDGKTRFFAREDDRATESYHRSSPAQNSIEDKLEKYRELFASNGCRSQWGIPNLRVMFITTKPDRAANIIASLADKPFADRFLFKVLPSFGIRSWRAPRDPLRELYEPWQTAAGDFDITRL